MEFKNIHAEVCQLPVRGDRSSTGVKEQSYDGKRKQDNTQLVNQVPTTLQNASDALEEEKCPTLPLAALYSALNKHLERTPVSEKIKARARHLLNTKLKISLLHKTATFLCPQFWQLRMLPKDERLEVSRMSESCLPVSLKQ